MVAGALPRPSLSDPDRRLAAARASGGSRGSAPALIERRTFAVTGSPAWPVVAGALPRPSLSDQESDDYVQAGNVVAGALPRPSLSDLGVCGCRVLARVVAGALPRPSLSVFDLLVNQSGSVW